MRGRWSSTIRLARMRALHPCLLYSIEIPSAHSAVGRLDHERRRRWIACRGVLSRGERVMEAHRLPVDPEHESDYVLRLHSWLPAKGSRPCCLRATTPVGVSAMWPAVVPGRR